MDSVMGDFIVLALEARVAIDPINIILIGGLVVAGVAVLKALIKRLSRG